MAIRMQGAWTIQVQTRSEGEAWRFIVTGADIGSGVHDGNPGKMVFVRGARWEITLQRRLRGGPWTEADHRIGATSVAHGLVEFDIQSRTEPTAGARAASPAGLVLVCMRLAGRLEVVRRTPSESLHAAFA